MKLIITEKENVAKDLNKALKGTHEKGYIKTDEFIITWCQGHLLEIDNSSLPQKWAQENLPIFPQKFNYSVIKEKAWLFKNIRELVSKADEIILATDADQEGELIGRLVLNNCGWTKWDKTKRFWESEALEPAVSLKGIKNAKNISEYDGLYYSGLSRQHADWLMGINLTQLVTVKAADGTVWSVGRVQTPTLRIIVERDLEIKNFKQQEYHLVKVIFEKDKSAIETHYKSFLGDPKQETEVNSLEEPKETEIRLNEEKALKIVTELKQHSFGTIQDLFVEEKMQAPPLLHFLNTLQQEANEIYGISAKETLECAQSLYDEHKVLSYPRTDSQYLADDNIALVEDILIKLGREDLINGVSGAGKRVFDSKKLGGHHAIIPLKKASGLKPNEQKIYDLVLRKFLGAFMPVYTFEKTVVNIQIGNYVFSTTGKVDKALGWKSLYKGEDSKEEPALPKIIKGEQLPKLAVKHEKKFTTPPPYITDATLLKKMERFSLGTQATIPDTIEKLINTKYIYRDKKYLKSTVEKGQELISKLNESKIADINFTSEWDERIKQISKSKNGSQDYSEFITGIKTYVSSEIELIKNKEIKGFNSATPKMLALAKDLAKARKIKITDTSFEAISKFISESKENPIELGKCGCGSNITDSKMAYNCTCGKVIWKEFAGKKINPKQAEALMQGKKVSLTGLKKKDGGGTYDATLFLKDDNKIGLEFPKK